MATAGEEPLTGEQTEVTVGPLYQSRFRAALPILPRGLAMVCLLLNLIPSGWGTLAAALFACCFPPSAEMSKGRAVCLNLCVFSLQLLTTPLLLMGYVWSLMWGCALLALSATRNDDDGDGDV